LRDDPTSAWTHSAEKDFVWMPGMVDRFTSVFVDAKNAKLLSFEQRRRLAKRVVVYGRYLGHDATPYYANDLALIHLDAAFPSQAVQPAVMAGGDDADWKPLTTIAGYGYSDAGGGTFGVFGLTWPPAVSRGNGEMKFSLKDEGEYKSGFCQGDSGGPAFAGRARGCKAEDILPEARPRVLEGIVSYMVADRPGSSQENLGNRVAASVAKCQKASDMVMQDVTTSDRRQWVCRTSGNAVGGCRN
jgi:hypothetical protein